MDRYRYCADIFVCRQKLADGFIKSPEVWLFLSGCLSFGVVRHADCAAIFSVSPISFLSLTNRPGIEAVMVGIKSQSGISFVRSGVAIQNG